MSDVAASRTALRRERLPLAVVLVVVVAAAGLAWWMTGPAPAPVDEGLPSDPPPLALPNEVPERSPVAAAAARLATGDLDAARRGFVAAVAEAPDDVVAQTGLILSRWRSTGPRSVERDLEQLVNEYPEDAFPVLHLGLVRLMLQQDATARGSLRAARSMGWAAGDETGLRLARLADDLLHPGAFRGYLPVLVQRAEVGAAQRTELGALLAAVTRDDRPRALRAAEELERSADPFARIAAIGGRFTKDDPAETARLLDDVATDRNVPKAARHRATLLAGMAGLWGGGDRDAGCARIARAAAAGSDDATRRYARPIAAELCADR